MSYVGSEFTRVWVPLAAGAVVLDGDTVAVITGGPGVTSSGYGVPGQLLANLAPGAGLRALGYATGAFYDRYGNVIKVTAPWATIAPGNNSGGQDGDVQAEVQLGLGKGGLVAVDRLNGTGGDACTLADRWNPVYMLDNRTVSRLATGKATIGRLFSVSTDGSKVRVFFPVGGG